MSRPSRRRFAWCSALLLPLAFGSSTLGQAPLRWRFQKGETISYRVHRQTVHKAASDQPELSTTRVIDLRYQVESVDGTGAASLVQTIERIRIRVESAQGGSEYDTASPTEAQGIVKWMVPMLRAIVGQPVRMKMSPLGQVSQVQAPKETEGKLRKALGGDELACFLSAEGVAHMLGLPPLPEQPLSPGHRWPQSATLRNPALGDQTVETVFVYEGSESGPAGPVEKIASSARTELGPSPDMALKVAVRQQQSQGTARFDRAAGRMLSSQSHSTMKVETTLASTMGKDSKTPVRFGAKTFQQDVAVEQRVELVASRGKVRE